MVFVVPHTHWDREWYEPSARFRQRLLNTIDEVMGHLENDSEFDRFLLDGQCVLIDDYLSVRPERRPMVARLVEEGKLLLGPWYVLADELLSSGECLVRNLLMGTSVARSLGRRCDLGYSPDAFGHPAVLPTLLAGFGIEHALLWRGYGGETGQEGDLFHWTGPDGASCLVYHLPPPGYELGASLPIDRREMGRRWQEIVRTLEPRAGNRPLLLLNGADHHRPQPDLIPALRLLRRVASQYRFVIGSPVDYFAAVTEPPRTTVTGELRFSYRYTWTLQGVHATRARLKAAVAEGDRLLVRWAEPQAALAAISADADARPLLRAAWRDHLRNHFHDSLAGTVADDVARDVLQRARRVTVQARGVLVDALYDRLNQDRTLARRRQDRWTSTLVVLNPSPWPRDGVVEATVTVFKKRVRMGPPPVRQEVETRVPVEIPGLVGADGVRVPLQLLDRYDTYERLDSPDHYPLQDEVTAFRVALHARRVPSLGGRSYDMRDAERTARVRDQVGASRTAIHGGWCRVQGERSGGLTVRPRGDGRANVLALIESEGDEGDTYTFEPTFSRRAVRARWGRRRVVWRGPFVAALARPFSVGDFVRGTLYARLDAGSRLVRFVVEGENRGKQHRLRLLFSIPQEPLGGDHVSDMQFGPVVRRREDYDTREFPLEWPVATAPMHRYVSIPGAFTVFARDRFEYELRQDGMLAVTLFRAVGELSKPDLAARLGHAAWPAATPLAQEPGHFRAELAVCSETVGAGSPPKEWHRIERLAEEFHAPLTGLMLRSGIDVPSAIEGPALSGAGLAFTSLKPAEFGPGVVLRCVNLSDERTQGEWKFPFPLRRAVAARLDETALRELKTTRRGRGVPFVAEPREVVTIVVEAE